MLVKIPFSLFPPRILVRISRMFIGIAEAILPLFPFLETSLMQAEFDISKRRYVSLCLASSVSFFVIFSVITELLLIGLGYYFIGPTLVLIISLFMFINQIMYPKLVILKKVNNIERNLLPALRSILIQVNSGVPLFNVMVGISNEDYGEISKEFSKMVKEINAGTPEIEAIEEVSTQNPSTFFRRSLWQIVNGMKSGSSIESVLRDVIDTLSQEQIIQIESYGSTLNPLAMFYMLVAIILPALSMVLLIVVSSFLGISSFGVQVMFFGLFFLVLFLQIMFLGLIKSKRPNLLGV